MVSDEPDESSEQTINEEVRYPGAAATEAERR